MNEIEIIFDAVDSMMNIVYKKIFFDMKKFQLIIEIFSQTCKFVIETLKIDFE